MLKGNLLHDQYNYVSPGVLGAANGGMDFNDIVHPFARCIIEGLFGCVFLLFFVPSTTFLRAPSIT